MKRYLINGISVPLGTSEAEVCRIAEKKLRRMGVSAFDAAPYKRSVDARDRTAIRLVWSVSFAVEDGMRDEKLQKLGLHLLESGKVCPIYGDKPLAARPVVVGMGPCGLFAALLLAENGYRPVVLERGGDVADRVRAVEDFYKDGVLDENSNIQFGAGGAGTFSDGKLVTRVNDPLCAYVLERFAAFGAPREILTLAKPHIGTDVLRTVVENLAARILALGGEIRYHTAFTGYSDLRSGVRTVYTSRGELPASALVLAIGHSARDTYKMLMERGCSLTAKDFSVGLRIEHRKEDIDRALYGDFAGHPDIPYAEYNLSWNTKVRGVYTFCMCPGGEVVAGASERGGLCVNGMSRFARDGENSNSAVCVSVFRGDYGGSPGKAIDFQRTLERAAFAAGGGDFAAPVSTVKDFLENTACTGFSRVQPTYMGGKVRGANLRALFPTVLGDTLAAGLCDFGRKIRGFDAPDALLSGVETRTSAPLRIERGEDLVLLGEHDIYPGGEGAGYAGGITSAAVDGIRIALAVMEKYKPFA